MSQIKNNLLSVFLKDKNIDLINDLSIYINENYRSYDPGQYLYNLITNVPYEEKFTDSFIELTYTTLIAWNMNQRGAKLSEYELFKDSLLENQKTISSLKNYRIERSPNKEHVKEQIKSLLIKLQLVDKNKPKLVTFSKTMHFFLPHLLMPIDRSYTLQFFYRNTNFEKKDDKQLKIYFEIFDQVIQLAENYDFTKHIDNRWNRNVPKIIDNLIIAYISIQRNKLRLVSV